MGFGVWGLGFGVWGLGLRGLDVLEASIGLGQLLGVVWHCGAGTCCSFVAAWTGFQIGG